MYRRYGYRRRRTTRRYGSYRGIRRIRGRGSYFGEFGRTALNYGGSALGSALGFAGGPVGGVVGGALGHTLGSAIADVAGLGGYTVRRNELMKLDEGAQVPAFGDLNHGIIVCHREYIKDIAIPATPATFTLDNFPINPGQSKTFPWLAHIAAAFDQYELRGMLFEFKSTSSDFGTTTSLAMGSVMMATDYDSADSNYLSKIEMENAQYSTSTKPSISCIHAVECDPSITGPSGLKYVRTGGVPTNRDIRLYDHGNFQLATQGLPTGSSGVIGELWVTYKIAFYKPQLTAGTDIPTSLFLPISPSGSDYFGLTRTTPTTNSIDLTLNGNTITFNNALVGGRYSIFYCTTGNATLLTNAFAFSGSGYTIASEKKAAANATDTNQWFHVIVRLTASPASFVVGTATYPGVITNTILLVTMLDQEPMVEQGF